MAGRVKLFYLVMAITAIWMGAMRARAQIVIDSGLVRELFFVVRDPTIPEYGFGGCFQIGDSIFSSDLTEIFYDYLSIPWQTRFGYCGIDTQIVMRLNRITDSLADNESWYSLRVRHDHPIRVDPLNSGDRHIDTNISGRCFEFGARYAVIDAYSRCDGGGNMFEYFGDIHHRHIVLLHVDTSTVHLRPVDPRLLRRLVDNKKTLDSHVFQKR